VGAKFVADRDDRVCELIAHKVIDAGKDGFGNAVAITEIVVKQFRR
jgi:hypothetical protein